MYLTSYNAFGLKWAWECYKSTRRRQRRSVLFFCFDEKMKTKLIVCPMKQVLWMNVVMVLRWHVWSPTSVRSKKWPTFFLLNIRNINVSVWWWKCLNEYIFVGWNFIEFVGKLFLFLLFIRFVKQNSFCMFRNQNLTSYCRFSLTIR